MAKRVSRAVEAVPSVQPRILVIRGQRVMLDRDLADVYGVSTKRLNEQVKRQGDRFPEDFMFQLTEGEASNLRSQFATSSSAWGGRRYRPFAFTEHGAVMAASVLQTPTAVRASIFVVRAFIRLRELLASNAELARKLAELEQRMVGHDRQFLVVLDAIRKLMEPPPAPPPAAERKSPMGF